MTSEEHLNAAESILGQPQTLFDGTPAPTTTGELQLAQCHLLAAIAIELGAPHAPAAPATGVTQ